MAILHDLPADLETWTGGTAGLRLFRHPRLVEARSFVAEFPLTIRRTRPLGPSGLGRGDAARLVLCSLPVYRRSSIGEAMELRLELDCPPHDVPVAFARLRLEGGGIGLEEHLVVLPGQRQVACFPFPAIDAPLDLAWELRLRDGGTWRDSVRLIPEPRLTIHLVFQTHLDLGWTARAAEVVTGLRRMTAEVATRICRSFADRPEGERFVWTCEVSEALRLAWEGCDPVQRRELQACIRERLIRCSALPFSFHSGIMDRNLLRAALRQARALADDLGVAGALDLSVVQQSDVPGSAWFLPDELAASGVRRALLNHNHLVRGCHLPPLFRWRGPRGGELLAAATSGYAEYGSPTPVPGGPEDLWGLSVTNPCRPPLPGTAVLTPVCYGENCGPEFAGREVEAVAAWNRRFAWPRIRIGGPEEWFAQVESEVDVAALPVVSGEISDWWIHGVGSTPRSLAAFRRAQARLPAVRGPRAAALEDELLRYAEHTFGLNSQLVRHQAAAAGGSLTGFGDYAASWEDKEAYAARAAALASEVASSAPVPAGTAWTIATDAAGIVRLEDPHGQAWFERAAGRPPFAGVLQRLIPVDVGEWFHHDPPSAPDAGDRWAALATVRSAPGEVELAGPLASPAGGLGRVGVRVRADASGDLLIEVALAGKTPTARSEGLFLSLPFLAPRPTYRIDVGGDLLVPDRDQLPDANRHTFPAWRGWIIEDAGRRLAVSSAECALWSFGALCYPGFGQEPGPRIGEAWAHLFNNLWQTNFRCWIAGDLAFRLRLRALPEGFDEQAALDSLQASW
jgi:hypothetical protein